MVLVSCILLRASAAAETATSCRADVVPPVGEQELRRLRILTVQGDEPDSEGPAYFFRADIDNDGKSEVIGVGYSGSEGYLDLSLFQEKESLKPLPLPPPPPGLDNGEGHWLSSYPASNRLLVRLCGKTYIAVSGVEFDSLEGFLWASGRTIRACDPNWTKFQRGRFQEKYDRKLFDQARSSLRSYMRTCGSAIGADARIRMLSDLAVASLNLRDYHECLSAVNRAKALPEFEQSPAKKAILFNEAACASPKPFTQRPDYRWLIGGAKVTPEVREQREENLLANTVPDLNLSTAPNLSLSTARLDSRAQALIDRSYRPPNAAPRDPDLHLDLRTRVRRTLLSPDDDEPAIRNRYVWFSGFRPHDAPSRAMIWADVDTGASMFALNDFYGCFAIGSRSIGPKDIPREFKAAFRKWEQDKQERERACTLYLDGRTSTVEISSVKLD
jgi:hypothetical protein